MNWTGSDRRSRLPSDWPQIRVRILKRDPTCVCTGCTRCQGACLRTSTDVDHIIPIDDHSDSNLRGLCNPCHLAKSSLEGHASTALAARRRPPEPHPGVIA